MSKVDEESVTTDMRVIQRAFDDRLVKMNECFLGFGFDPDENINRLTALCGELLDATCALYDRLENGLLCSWGQWNTPTDFNPVDFPEGHICYDVILHADSKLFVVRNLSKSRYAETDPNVKRYNLETYVGQVVKCAGNSVGSLCVVYQKDYEPNEADGKLMGIIATAVGIEEECKQALESLRQSEERYRTVVNQSYDGIFLLDPDTGRLHESNPAMSELLEYSLEELANLTIYDIVADERDIIDLHIQSVIESNTDFLAQRRYKRKDSSTVNVEVSASVIQSEGQRFICVQVRDLTARKRMESEMLRLERMRALGKMSQGIAHNFNNILSVVLGCSELAKERTTDTESAARIEEVIASALRGEELVKRLSQALGTREEINLQPVSISKVANEVIEATRPRWKDQPEARGRKVQIVTDFGDTRNIRGSESGMHDILINLLFNAVDAMPDGGAITIQTSSRGEEVELAVSDTGVGMSEETRQRVFEPFFTTKSDVGTGLGLATVYGTVTRWGGRIDVESILGRGTTLTLRIPASDDSETIETPVSSATRGRRSKIVIVEDDEFVSTMLTRILSDHHDVQTISSGREVLEQLQPDFCDVALIDLGMPDMPGDQVADEIKNRLPFISTVLLTGWVLNENDPRLTPFDFALGKPVRASQLRDVIGQAVILRDRS